MEPNKYEHLVSDMKSVTKELMRQYTGRIGEHNDAYSAMIRAKILDMAKAAEEIIACAARHDEGVRAVGGLEAVLRGKGAPN